MPGRKCSKIGVGTVFLEKTILDKSQKAEFVGSSSGQVPFFLFLPVYISEKSGETILAKKEIAGWRRLPC